MLRKWIAGFVLGICLSTGWAQLDSTGIRLLDSALQFYGLTHQDLWLAWDAVADDPHRLAVVKQVFEQPLSVFKVLDQYQQAAQYSVDRLLIRAQRDLECDPYRAQSLALRYTTRQMDSAVGFSIDERFSLPAAAVLRQILPLLMTATVSVEQVRAGWDPDSLQYVLTYLDSLLLPSEEAADLNLYELKAEEYRWNRISKKFFRLASIQMIRSLIHRSIDCLAYVLALPILNNHVSEHYRDIQPVEIPTPMGTIAIGGYGDDVYRKPYAVIIDFGGNDRYLFPSLTKEEKFRQPVQCIIDLAGNDVYVGGDYAWASAVFGMSFLIDVTGNDVYVGENFTQGSGVFGVGVLVDKAGHDRYIARSCAQGSGAFGIGVLWDSTGNDLYQCAAQGQGFGFTHGAGLLVDFAGNDLYTTTSPFQDFLRYDQHFLSFTQGAALGYRPIASGGIGLVLEFAGNDVYTSDIYGQGTAYWFGIGAICDQKGDDRYVSYQYAQGSGVHFAHGILWDRQGNDHYASHGVSQGCGHDVALGVLLDEAGDDDYTVESLSLGGGNADAISILLDYRGDDTYIARQEWNMLGYSDYRRRYGMLGLFIDGQGQDRYGETIVRNNVATLKSTFGSFYDAEVVEKPERKRTEPPLTPPDSLKEPLANSLDSLFIQASAAPQKYQYNVKPAREKIIAMGRAALPFLAKKLGTESARERHALVYILRKLYDRDTAAITQLVVDSLQSKNPRVLGMVAIIAGEKKIRAALPFLTPLLHHSQWRRRQLAAYVIGLIGDSPYADTLRLIWQTEQHPFVQMRLATAIARLQPPWLWDWIVEPLQRSRWVVGPNTVETLRRYGDSLSWMTFHRIAQQLRNSPEALAMWMWILPRVRFASTDTSSIRRWIASLSLQQQRQLIAQFWRQPKHRWADQIRRALRKLKPLQALLHRWEAVQRLSSVQKQ